MKRKIAIGVSVGIISACGLALFFFEDMVRASTVPDVPFDPTAVPEAPDYADAGAWASLPSVASNAMLVPEGIERSNEPPPADVFFIHPTTYLDDEGWNAPTDGPLATELLDQFVLAIQASAFNGCCRVFAPRYRQATLGVVFAEPGESIRALELAYDDVVRAFNHFLTDHSQGRPFLIAGHSQGSLHGMRLILEHVSDTPLQSRLVAAYLPGAAVPPEGLGSIRSCPEEEPASTHCVLSWQTFLDGVDATKAPHNRFEPGDGTYSYAGTGLPTEAACANPMAWTDISDSAVLAPEDPSPVSFLTKEPAGTVIDTLPPPFDPQIEANCSKGVLVISEPSEERFNQTNLFGQQGDFHIFDYNLFYMHVRENARRRVQAHLAPAGRAG